MTPISIKSQNNKFLFLSAIVMLLVWSTLVSACNDEPSPTTQASMEENMTQDFLPYSDFIIGETTGEEIMEYFARDPDQSEVMETDFGEYTRLCYAVASDFFLDCFYIDQAGVLALFMAYLPEDSDITHEGILEYFPEYEYEYEAYTTFAESARMMIHASDGAAFLVNIDTGGVIAFERFEPMALDDYLATWGKDLPEDDPYIK